MRRDTNPSIEGPPFTKTLPNLMLMMGEITEVFHLNRGVDINWGCLKMGGIFLQNFKIQC